MYTYALVTQLLHPYWEGDVPYNVVLVELEEGIRIVSNLVDCPNESIRIGMPVSVVFE
ncbi:MAG: OB-fold domain-containing protein, partial [Deltaproteobacteria bacterium]|nr:OB-fold domain-containing protein [Deltaproteobacteria bacterium]